MLRFRSGPLDNSRRHAIICTMTQIRKNLPASRHSRPNRCCPNLADLLDPRLFRALADANRLSLFMRLAACGKPCTVGQLNACCPVDLSVVSRHLAILREAGALESTKRGKEVYYRVNFERLVPLMRGIAGALENCQCDTNSCCFSAIDRAANPSSPPNSTPARRQPPRRTTDSQSRKDRSS